MLIEFKHFVSPLRLIRQFRTSCIAMKSQQDLREGKVQVGENSINVVRSGSGQHAVLCLPGALGSALTDFAPQLASFDRQNFTLLAWDPPGYGRSRPPQRHFPTNFYEADADDAHKLMKVLGYKKYSLLGWSDGGISGMIQAAKYPLAVKKLVVWGTNAFILPHELEVYKSIRDINTWSKRMRQPMIDVYGEKTFAELWAAWVDAMVALYNAQEGNICAEKLKDIKCPTFILYGEKDPMVDKVHASHLHTNIVGSQLHLYPEGKHNIHLKYTEDFNQRVAEFLLQD